MEQQRDVAGLLRVPGPGATGGRFRYVLLWFTTPPKAGPTVKVTEVTLKG